MVKCPSIQITTISPEDEPAPTVSRYWDMGDGSSGGWDRERLYLPLLDPFTYRDRCPSSPSPSPASSPSSRGWLSPASSCDSLLVEEEDVNDATMNFVHLPSSRPTSPGSKKRRNTPLTSPYASRRGSYSEDLPGCNFEGGDSISLTQAQPSSCELNIPQKTRKTSLGQVEIGASKPQHLGKATNHALCPVVVSQGGGPGAGSRAKLTLPALRDPEGQERCSITGHGLSLRTSCPCLGPGPRQCPQSFIQARIHITISMINLN